MRIPFLDLPAMHRELGAELDAAWRQVSSSASFIGGECVDRFEAEWADYCGTKHCVGLSNGTAALQLALTGLGIGAGDEVIVPASTFVATAAAVAAAGATPVFVDVDPATLLVTAPAVEAAITPRTAAVVVVHLYGQPADMDAIRRVASAAGIAVVEDAAQAHGASWNGKRAGSLSDIGCFSFYPGKNLGAFGDAGAIVTDDPALAGRIRSISNHGRVPNDAHRHEILGGNHRLDGLQAAVLSVKLERLDAWNAGRQRAAELYEACLAGLPIEIVKTAEAARSAYHLFVIQTSHRDALRQGLAQEGIATGIHYPVACHRQPAFLSTTTPRLPVAERAADRVVSLPMFPHLGESDIKRVAAAIKRALSELAPSERLAS
jgi:dTDP-4-amino-4,6-dideoxygalactose transaminase